ncbi:unnamed protein product, partial [marine sediment metagenome]
MRGRLLTIAAAVLSAAGWLVAAEVAAKKPAAPAAKAEAAQASSDAAFFGELGYKDVA